MKKFKKWLKVEANKEADKKKRESVDLRNQADSQYFQQKKV